MSDHPSNSKTYHVPDNLRNEVNFVAKSAGNFIKRQLSQLESGDIKVKDLNSLVSYVDVETEKSIVAGLKKLLPNAGFITEEETVSQVVGQDQYVWVIDPLDGTTNFIHQIPFFSVSIALKYREQYILGVVYDVMNDICFSAVSGQGAWANDGRIQVSVENQLDQALLATGFPYNSFEQMEAYLALFRVLFQSTRGIRRLGSAALDLCYVAKGSFTGFFEYGLNEWDIAAGICILKEAGGHVSDFQGGAHVVKNKTILATNNYIHLQMLDLIGQHFSAAR